jgi:hypothetical protein
MQEYINDNESFTEHHSNSTPVVSQHVKKKELSVAALSLCHPINEEVSWLRREFVCGACGRQGEKPCKTGNSLLVPYLSEKKYH